MALLAPGLATADVKPASVQQVQVEARFLTVRSDGVRELPFDWSGNAPGFRTAEPGLTDLPVLGALLRGRDAKLLAQPKAVTRSGEAARFRVGGELTLPDRTVPDFGIDLQVVPRVTQEGTLRLAIRLEVDETAPVGVGPVLTSQVVENETLLRDGQTVVIGGLFTDATREAAGSLPALGRVPVLGALFRQPGFAAGDLHLILTVTPALYDEEGQRVPTVRQLPRNPQIEHPRIDPDLHAPNVPQYPQQPRSPSYPSPR